MKAKAKPTDDEIVSQYMSDVAKARWAKKTPAERSAEARARLVKRARRER